MGVFENVVIYIGIPMLVLGFGAIAFLIWIFSGYLFPKEPVRHGDSAECGHCGYMGIVSGRLDGTKFTAPWCPNCQKNDKLTLY